MMTRTGGMYGSVKNKTVGGAVSQHTGPLSEEPVSGGKTLVVHSPAFPTVQFHTMTLTSQCTPAYTRRLAVLPYYRALSSVCVNQEIAIP